MTETKSDVLKRIENLKQALKGHWNNTADIEWIEKYILDLPAPPAPAQGVEEAILALQKAVQVAEYDNDDPLATSWTEQVGVLISLSDAKKLLAGSRWQQGRQSMSVRSAINAGSIENSGEGYIGDRIKKEMKGFYSFNHPARKTFDDVCWRLYGMTPDTLFENFRNNTSAFWLDIILPAMQEYADKAAPAIGARWVKASERLPGIVLGKQHKYVCRDSQNHAIKKHLKPEDISVNYEWLDESPCTCQQELDQLRAWKKEATEVMPDFQAIAKELDIPLGETVHDKILPWIKEMSAFKKVVESNYPQLQAIQEELGVKKGTEILPAIKALKNDRPAFPTREDADNYIDDNLHVFKESKSLTWNGNFRFAALAMYDWLVERLNVDAVDFANCVCTCDPEKCKDEGYRYSRQVLMELPVWSKDRQRRISEGLSPQICVDPCIVPAIRKLWDQGIETLGCCCGHNIEKFGKAWANIAPEHMDKAIALGYQVHPIDEHGNFHNTIYL